MDLNTAGGPVARLAHGALPLGLSVNSSDASSPLDPAQPSSSFRSI